MPAAKSQCLALRAGRRVRRKHCRGNAKQSQSLRECRRKSQNRQKMWERVRRTLKRSNLPQNLGQRRKPASSQQLTRKSKGWRWRCVELLQRRSRSLPASDLRYGYIIASLGCPVQDPWINIESGFQFSIKKKNLPYPSPAHPSPAPQRKPLFKKYFKRKEGSSG